MMIAGIIFIAIGAVCLIGGGICIAATILFAKFPGETGKVPGSLKRTEHRKNVTVYGRFPNKPMRVKDLTKATYSYTVNGKIYKLRDTHFFTRPKQVNYLVTVVYLKRFPRIAYTMGEYGVDNNFYWLYAFTCIFPAALFLLYGIRLICGV